MDDLGRYLIVLSFLVAGSLNLTPARVKDHIDRMAAFRTPFPAAAFWIGQAMLFAGCLMIVANWHADVGVWLLVAFMVFATAIFHRFWSMADPMKRNFSRIAFTSNIAIVGGLLLLLRAVA